MSIDDRRSGRTTRLIEGLLMRGFHSRKSFLYYLCHNRIMCQEAQQICQQILDRYAIKIERQQRNKIILYNVDIFFSVPNDPSTYFLDRMNVKVIGRDAFVGWDHTLTIRDIHDMLR